MQINIFDLFPERRKYIFSQGFNSRQHIVKMYTTLQSHRVHEKVFIVQWYLWQRIQLGKLEFQFDVCSLTNKNSFNGRRANWDCSGTYVAFFLKKNVDCILFCFNPNYRRGIVYCSNLVVIGVTYKPCKTKHNTKHAMECSKVLKSPPAFIFCNISAWYPSHVSCAVALSSLPGSCLLSWEPSLFGLLRGSHSDFFCTGCFPEQSFLLQGSALSVFHVLHCLHPSVHNFK